MPVTTVRWINVSQKFRKVISKRLDEYSRSNKNNKEKDSQPANKKPWLLEIGVPMFILWAIWALAFGVSAKISDASNGLMAYIVGVEKKQRSFADKLKTAEDKRAYVGEKLRNGKKDVSETRAELLENTRIKKQSRSKTTQMSYAIAAETVHRVSDVTNADNTQENEEDVASQIVKKSENATQNTLISKKQKYGRKLHNKQRIKETEGETSAESKSKLGERKHKKGDSLKSKKDEVLGNEKSKEIQKLRLKAKMQRKIDAWQP